MVGILSRVMARGTVVGGAYRVEERIGGGGMATVYRAHRTSDGRAVALKVVRDATPDLLARLEREARITGAIDHPNLIRVYDVLRHDDGSPVVVMELLHGETLGAKLLRESRLSVPEVARIALGIVGALEAAHARAVVHRDLKPDNVFLTSVDGLPFVKVLDFGIAKAIEGADITAGLPTLETRTGHIVGTPQYMSPEQIFGEQDVDHRADVWALGVLLYEALAGVRPFDGANVGQVLKAIALEPPVPLARRQGSLPPEILALVERMLTYAREERLSDLDDVRGVLTPFAAALPEAAADVATAPTVELDVRGPSPAQPPEGDGPVRRRRWALLTRGAVVVAVIGMGSGVLWTRAKTAAVVAPSSPVASMTPTASIAAAFDVAPAVTAALPLDPRASRDRAAPPLPVAPARPMAPSTASPGPSASASGGPVVERPTSGAPPASSRGPRSGALRRDEF
jgi:eukaryotic-like serine/threonine-protein kinase